MMVENPSICPLCHHHIIPSKITEGHLNAKQTLQAVFKCTNERCKELFITNYRTRTESAGVFPVFVLNDMQPSIIEDRKFSDEITSLSPSFVEIYNQAKTADEIGLDEICGPGYRKSLEFLIKDYLISTGHSDEEIKSKLLGACLNMIQDNRIKTCAERATWLGNDETHYVRK